MTLSVPYCVPSKSKLRRDRAIATRKKLYDSVQQCSSLVGIQSQLVMLTASVDNLQSVLHGLLMGSIGSQAGPHFDWDAHANEFVSDTVQQPNQADAVTSAMSSDDLEGRKADWSEVAQGSASCILQRPLDVVPRGLSTGPSGQSVNLGPTEASHHDPGVAIRHFMQQAHQGLVRRVDLYDNCETMVYQTKGDSIPTVVQIERASLRDVLGHIRAKRIPIALHLQAKYVPKNSSNGCVPAAAEEPEDAGQDVFAASLSSDVPPLQGQANTADVLMFSRSQLSHVVDFTISGFAEKHALPASMFRDLADMAKQALPDAGDESEDPEDVQHSQVQKLIEVVTKGCLDIAASVTNDAYGEE